MSNVDVCPRGGVLTFDPSVASLDTIQRAALKFTGLCSFDIAPNGNHLVVTVSFPFKHQVDTVEVIGRFRNEVLDQTLRERIASETVQERNLILAYAFSNTKLIEK